MFLQADVREWHEPAVSIWTNYCGHVSQTYYNKPSAIPLTVFDLCGIEGGHRAGGGARSDTKRSGKQLNACKRRHGSSGGVTLLDTLLDARLTLRAHSVGDECWRRTKRNFVDTLSSKSGCFDWMLTHSRKLVCFLWNGIPEKVRPNTEGTPEKQNKVQGVFVQHLF